MLPNMEDIAIIGFACKLPQDITDSESYWKIIAEGKNVMTDWPESRMRLDAFYNAESRIQDSVRLTE
jgi:acyl transferase domain-containing protein